MVFGCFGNDKLAGGIYVSNSMSSLFIEQIFIDPSYQNKGIGSKFLKYVFENKREVEEFFNTKFNKCRLESKNRDSFYKMLGFTEENNIIGTMKKRM